jgi:hypothetical protein
VALSARASATMAADPSFVMFDPPQQRLMTIVVTSYRYKRPPPKKKQKGPAVEVAAVVHRPQPKPEADTNRSRPTVKPPTAAAPLSRPPLPTVVVATNQKRLKRLRAELRMAELREPNPEVEAFFARNVRPGGPIPPKQ